MGIWKHGKHSGVSTAGRSPYNVGLRTAARLRALQPRRRLSHGHTALSTQKYLNREPA